MSEIERWRRILNDTDVDAVFLRVVQNITGGHTS